MPISLINFKSTLYTIFFVAIIAAATDQQASAEDQDNAPPAVPAASDSATDITPTPAPTPVAKAKEEAPKAITRTLQDGTKIEIDSDGTVTLSNTDGSKSVAPDGVYTLRDETTFAVKDGKKTDQ